MLLYTREINNKVLLYSTENYIQHRVITIMEKNMKQIHREEAQAKMLAGIRVMCAQAKETQELSEARNARREAWNGFSFSFIKNQPCQHLDLGAWPSEP